MLSLRISKDLTAALYAPAFSFRLEMNASASTSQIFSQSGMLMRLCAFLRDSSSEDDACLMRVLAASILPLIWVIRVLAALY